jgi:hypothetical protein
MWGRTGFLSSKTASPLTRKTRVTQGAKRAWSCWAVVKLEEEGKNERAGLLSEQC